MTRWMRVNLDVELAVTGMIVMATWGGANRPLFARRGYVVSDPLQWANRLWICGVPPIFTKDAKTDGAPEVAN